MKEQWQEFKPGAWVERVDVRDFIQKNYRPFSDGPEFLTGTTEKTRVLWETVLGLLAEERKRAASWISIQVLFPRLLPMSRVI